MRPVLAACLLTACLPTTALDRLDRTGTAQAGGYSFRVDWNLETARATRTNVVFRPNLSAVTLAAIDAVQSVTGCTVVPNSAVGDVAMITMSLDCLYRTPATGR